MQMAPGNVKRLGSRETSRPTGVVTLIDLYRFVRSYLPWVIFLCQLYRFGRWYRLAKESRSVRYGKIYEVNSVFRHNSASMAIYKL